MCVTSCRNYPYSIVLTAVASGVVHIVVIVSVLCKATQPVFLHVRLHIHCTHITLTELLHCIIKENEISAAMEDRHYWEPGPTFHSDQSPFS
jgi:hypothetical protein